jgi:hypothetical protein
MSEMMSPASFRMPPRRLFWPNSMASIPSIVAHAMRTSGQTGRTAKSRGLSAKHSNAPMSTDPVNDKSVT